MVCFLTRLTWKRASRHNSVHFFDMTISKSGPIPSAFLFPTLPCGFFVFLAASRRRLRLRRLRLPPPPPSTHHHPHNTINTQHHQHITIHTTPSTHNIINTSSTQHHQHTWSTSGSFCVASAALGAPPVCFAWQAQHLEHLHRGQRKSGDE